MAQSGGDTENITEPSLRGDNTTERGPDGALVTRTVVPETVAQIEAGIAEARATATKMQLRGLARPRLQ